MFGNQTRRALTGALVASFVAAAITAVTPAVLQAQNRFEKTFAYQIDKTETLTAVVGPVKIGTVKVTNMGRGYGRGGFGIRSANPPSELSTTLRFAFDVDNPASEEWDVTFTVELLDKSGKVIDRASKKENYEDEAKALNLDHSIIEYVLPLVSEVKVTLEGRRS